MAALAEQFGERIITWVQSLLSQLAESLITRACAAIHSACANQAGIAQGEWHCIMFHVSRLDLR